MKLYSNPNKTVAQNKPSNAGKITPNERKAIREQSDNFVKQITNNYPPAENEHFFSEDQIRGLIQADTKNGISTDLIKGCLSERKTDKANIFQAHDKAYFNHVKTSRTTQEPNTANTNTTTTTTTTPEPTKTEPQQDDTADNLQNETVTESTPEPTKTEPQQDNTAGDLQNEPVTKSAPAKSEPQQLPKEQIQPAQDTAEPEPEPATTDAEQHDTRNDEEYTNEELKEICGKIAEFSQSSMTAGQFMKITATHKDKRTVNEWLINNDCSRFIPKNQKTEPEPINIELDQKDKNIQTIALNDRLATSKDRINKLKDESAKAKLNEKLTNLKTETDPSKLTELLYNLSLDICTQEDKENETKLLDGSIVSQDPNNLAAFLGTPNSQLNNIEIEPLDTSLAEKEIEDTKEIERQAEEIYKSGKALSYICESINKYHKGDKLQAKALMLSYAVTKVRNEKGLNIMLTGDAGKGKSHLTETGLEHLPKYAYDKARYSDKALFHHNIPDAQVLVFDDQALSEILQECIKVMTTDIKVHSKYKTVNTHKKVNPNDPNGNAETLNLPANCPIWIAKVEPNGDEQIRDRCICLWIDESEEQDMSIRSFQNQTAINPDMIIDDTTKKISCKIWDFMPKENEATVVIPYANDIIQRNVNDHRKYDQLLDVVKASAVMAADSRYKNDKGYIEANISDFITACSIMNSIIEGAGGSIDGTPRASIDFLYKCLANKPTGVYTRSELQDLTGKSESAISRIINGRKVTGTNEYVGGLKDLCPAISDVDKTAGDLRMKSILWNREVFQQWQKDRNTLFVMEPERKAFWEECEKQKLRETVNE